MKSATVRLLLVVPFCVVAAQTALGSVPGSMEITCDVDRRTFRTLAKNETQVTFRLREAQTGGSQCGPDHVALMKDLKVFNSKTDRFDAQGTRRFASIRTVLGSDASPVQLCSGQEIWLDVQLGATTLTCAFSEDDDAKNPPPPPARKRVHPVPFAQQGGQMWTLVETIPLSGSAVTRSIPTDANLFMVVLDRIGGSGNSVALSFNSSDVFVKVSGEDSGSASDGLALNRSFPSGKSSGTLVEPTSGTFTFRRLPNGAGEILVLFDLDAIVADSPNASRLEVASFNAGPITDMTFTAFPSGTLSGKVHLFKFGW